LSGLFNLNEFLKDLILPPLCPVCGRISPDFICKKCAEDIKFFGFNICTRCGEPLSGHDDKDIFDKTVSNSKICSLCKNERYNFYRLRSFTEYNDTTSKIILKYKYKKYYYLADLLVDFLELAYKSYYFKEKIDFLETVPDYSSGLYANEIKNRNHMNPVAERLSRSTGIPFLNNVIKIRETERQHVLDRTNRKINLKGAFKVIDTLKVHRRNFLIIDDVWTTGSTLNELSAVLKNAGANKIFLLTVARKI
jgi:competence protein ComFC